MVFFRSAMALALGVMASCVGAQDALAAAEYGVPLWMNENFVDGGRLDDYYAYVSTCGVSLFSGGPSECTTTTTTSTTTSSTTVTTTSTTKSTTTTTTITTTKTTTTSTATTTSVTTSTSTTTTATTSTSTTTTGSTTTTTTVTGTTTTKTTTTSTVTTTTLTTTSTTVTTSTSTTSTATTSTSTKTTSTSTVTTKTTTTTTTRTTTSTTKTTTTTTTVTGTTTTKTTTSTTRTTTTRTTVTGTTTTKTVTTSTSTTTSHTNTTTTVTTSTSTTSSTTSTSTTSSTSTTTTTTTPAICPLCSKYPVQNCHEMQPGETCTAIPMETACVSQTSGDGSNFPNLQCDAVADNVAPTLVSGAFPEVLCKVCGSPGMTADTHAEAFRYTGKLSFGPNQLNNQVDESVVWGYSLYWTFGDSKLASFEPISLVQKLNITTPPVDGCCDSDQYALDFKSILIQGSHIMIVPIANGRAGSNHPYFEMPQGVEVAINDLATQCPGAGAYLRPLTNLHSCDTDTGTTTTTSSTTISVSSTTTTSSTNSSTTTSMTTSTSTTTTGTSSTSTKTTRTTTSTTRTTTSTTTSKTTTSTTGTTTSTTLTTTSTTITTTVTTTTVTTTTSTVTPSSTSTSTTKTTTTTTTVTTTSTTISTTTTTTTTGSTTTTTTTTKTTTSTTVTTSTSTVTTTTITTSTSTTTSLTTSTSTTTSVTSTSTTKSTTTTTTQTTTSTTVTTSTSSTTSATTTSTTVTTTTKTTTSTFVPCTTCNSPFWTGCKSDALNMGKLRPGESCNQNGFTTNYQVGHDSCLPGEFWAASSSSCAPCANCTACSDGVDGTCGSCDTAVGRSCAKVFKVQASPCVEYENSLRQECPAGNSQMDYPAQWKTGSSDAPNYPWYAHVQALPQVVCQVCSIETPQDTDEMEGTVTFKLYFGQNIVNEEIDQTNIKGFALRWVYDYELFLIDTTPIVTVNSLVIDTANSAQMERKRCGCNSRSHMAELSGVTIPSLTHNGQTYQAIGIMVAPVDTGGYEMPVGQWVPVTDVWTTTTTTRTTETTTITTITLPPANLQVITTALSSPVLAGATSLPVASQAGFAVGDSITICCDIAQARSETKTIASFGSINLDSPLQYAYPAGASIQTKKVIAVSTSTAPTQLPPKLNTGGADRARLTAALVATAVAAALSVF